MIVIVGIVSEAGVCVDIVVIGSAVLYAGIGRRAVGQLPAHIAPEDAVGYRGVSCAISRVNPIIGIIDDCIVANHSYRAAALRSPQTQTVPLASIARECQ